MIAAFSSLQTTSCPHLQARHHLHTTYLFVYHLTLLPSTQQTFSVTVVRNNENRIIHLKYMKTERNASSAMLNSTVVLSGNGDQRI